MFTESPISGLRHSTKFDKVLYMTRQCMLELFTHRLSLLIFKVIGKLALLCAHNFVERSERGNEQILA